MSKTHYIKKIIQNKLGISQIISEQKKTIEQQNLLTAYQQEVLKANLFRDTIQDSEWFTYKSISPGESAVDYGLCYTLYRVLSTIKPSNILEFGLGQSSKLIHQYANYYHCKAITVEHDKDWIAFFKADTGNKYSMNVQLMELEEIDYKGYLSLSYKDCHSVFHGQKFDLILVDGPFGYGNDIIYSRPQIIELAKDCLAENFVIIIDDYNRQGEKNTVKEVIDYFEQNNIPFVQRVYSASKQHILITTPKQKFLTTL